MGTRIRSPISPMSGHSPATPRLAIRTGSWLAREARARSHSLAGILAGLAIGVMALALSIAASDAFAARHSRGHSRALPPAVAPVAERQLPYPQIDLPFQVNGGQYAPLAWSDIAGWNDD